MSFHYINFDAACMRAAPIFSKGLTELDENHLNPGCQVSPHVAESLGNLNSCNTPKISKSVVYSHVIIPILGANPYKR